MINVFITDRDLIKKTFLNNSAFTLLELAIVIAVLGIIVTVSMPKFSGIISGYRLDSSAREMTLNIRSLQQAAIKSENTGFKVVFNTSTGSYHIYHFINNANVLYKTVELPSNVQLVFVNFYNSTLEFSINGNPIYRIGGHISLRDKVTGEFLYVIIDSIGRVRVSAEPP